MARGIKKEVECEVAELASVDVIPDTAEFRARMIELGEKLTTELIDGRSRDVYQSCDMVIRIYQALNA